MAKRPDGPVVIPMAFKDAVKHILKAGPAPKSALSKEGDMSETATQKTKPCQFTSSEGVKCDGTMKINPARSKSTVGGSFSGPGGAFAEPAKADTGPAWECPKCKSFEFIKDDDQ